MTACLAINLTERESSITTSPVTFTSAVLVLSADGVVDES